MFTNRNKPKPFRIYFFPLSIPNCKRNMTSNILNINKKFKKDLKSVCINMYINPKKARNIDKLCKSVVIFALVLKNHGIGGVLGETVNQPGLKVFLRPVRQAVGPQPPLTLPTVCEPVSAFLVLKEADGSLRFL